MQVKKIPKHLGLRDAKRKPPARANSPPSEAIIVYNERSSPGAYDHIVDAEYSMWKPVFKKSGSGQTGELCSNWPKISTPALKIKVDNKANFRYPDD